MKNETFYEKAEIFAAHNGWECTGENIPQKLLMYEKTIGGKKVRLNVYYKARTIHIQFGYGQKQPSYKKASDKVLENVFADPHKNPHEQNYLPVPAAEKSQEKKLVPVQELLKEIYDLKQRVADLEQAFADNKLIPFNN